MIRWLKRSFQFNQRWKIYNHVSNDWVRNGRGEILYYTKRQATTIEHFREELEAFPEKVATLPV